MSNLASIFIVLTALLHIYFLILEMFLWTKPLGLKTFRMNAEKAALTKSLAANQGLYNGFLAAGLIWSVFHPAVDFKSQLAIFFLTCVLVAAAYGAYSVSKRILWIQGTPALLAFICVVY